jgi:hypothetical protein
MSSRLAESLRTASLEIDVELVHTAALLLDIARNVKDHKRAGLSGTRWSSRPGWLSKRS